jgi:hypothetical protein
MNLVELSGSVGLSGLKRHIASRFRKLSEHITGVFADTAAERPKHHR